jgi:hypothetical protein
MALSPSLTDRSLGRYSAEGKLLLAKMAVGQVVEKTRGGKSKNRLSHPAWKSRNVRGIPLSHNLGYGWLI